MPQKSADPPVARMTWGRAVPVLIICVIFDALRIFFEFFWFFGPALAATVCTAGVNVAIGTAVAGAAGKVVAAGCTAAAGTIGFLGAGPIQSFGIIMAMAVGLLGWGTITLILAITNPRIWKSSVWGWAWSVFSLGVSETPFVGTIPMLTITHARLYAAQIRKDKETLKQYRKEQEKITATMQMRERNSQMAQHLQRTQAANDAFYAQTPASNDAERAAGEIPEDTRQAA